MTKGASIAPCIQLTRSVCILQKLHLSGGVGTGSRLREGKKKEKPRNQRVKGEEMWENRERELLNWER